MKLISTCRDYFSTSLAFILLASLAVDGSWSGWPGPSHLAVRDDRVIRKIQIGGLKGQVVAKHKRGSKPIPHGEITLYHPNGKLALLGRYVDGKPAGRWMRWRANGEVFGNYSYTDGKLDGSTLQYWEGGKIARSAYYKGGNPEGQTLIFSRDGKIAHRRFYLKSKKRPHNLRYRYLCTQSKSKIDCKSIPEMEDDLSTFLSEDEIWNLLHTIDKFYDLFGIDSSRDILVSCGNDKLSSRKSSSMISTDTGSGRDSRFDIGRISESAFGDVTSITGSTGLFEAGGSPCGGLGSVGVGGSGSDGSGPGGRGRDGSMEDLFGIGKGSDQANIDSVIKGVEEGLKSCRESSMERYAGSMSRDYGSPYGAAGGDPRTIIIAGLVIVATAALEKLVDVAFDAATDDGYAKTGTPLGGGKTKYEHETNTDDYKIRDDLNGKTDYYTKNELGGETKTTVYDDDKKPLRGFRIHKEWEKKDANGKTVETGRVKSLPGSANRPEGEQITEVTTHNDDGSTTTNEYDSNGNLTKTTKKDKDGKVTSTTKYDKDGNPTTTTPGGGASQPSEPGASKCEKARAHWAMFKQMCEMSNWQTYDCQKFVRMMSGCVDPARITPVPDGDVTCNRSSEEQREAATRAACERKKGIMIPNPDGRDACDKPDREMSLDRDICSDPRAMCRPDAELERTVSESMYPER